VREHVVMVIVPLAGWEQSRGALEDQFAALVRHADLALVPEIELGVREQGEAEMARNERAPLHSITSSARSRMEGGSVMPSSFAVRRFATSWNRVGRSTGSSATLAPCRTLRAMIPTWR